MESSEIAMYIVRHGKTLFNITNKVQGFSNSPLTEDGAAQAVQLGKGLRNIEFAAAFCGDLGRQRDTAKYILSQNKNKIPSLIELYGLREWSFGGFEGKPIADMWKPICKKHGVSLGELKQNYKKLTEVLGYKELADEICAIDTDKKAESYDVIFERINRAMDEIIRVSRNEREKLKSNRANVLIVSSGMMITTILHIFGQEQYKEELITNCSVSILKYKDDRFYLEIAGDLSFLEQETID
ncbi:MAG: histidine phosphatase family protein [Elusimicrobiota bacterium]|jgi:probable phosphoglycerate mutase|nr:histidine phosphatase family protein [Elusimicrobiota bacterium]